MGCAVIYMGCGVINWLPVQYLTTLRLPYCTSVTDNGLSQLLPHLQSLKDLSLRGNPHVSTRTMRCIASSVPSMEVRLLLELIFHYETL
jgi:hypothetical protein